MIRTCDCTSSLSPLGLSLHVSSLSFASSILFYPFLPLLLLSASFLLSTSAPSILILSLLPPSLLPVCFLTSIFASDPAFLSLTNPTNPTPLSDLPLIKNRRLWPCRHQSISLTLADLMIRLCPGLHRLHFHPQVHWGLAITGWDALCSRSPSAPSPFFPFLPPPSSFLSYLPLSLCITV